MGEIGRQTKELMVTTLAKRLQSSPNLLITSFAKMTVSDANDLRKSLRQVESSYLVAKGTLAHRALQAVGWDGAAQLLEGSIGFVIAGPDAAKASKALIDFAKAHEGAIIVRGGWLDGAPLSSGEVMALAKLPSRQELLAQVVGAVEGPLTDLVNTLEGVLREVTFVLEEVATRRSATAPAPAAPAPAVEGGSTHG